MKKIGLIIVTIAMCIAFTVPASAVITAVNAGSGDALVVPLTFMAAEKNRIALRNNSNEFVQAHIRFRTGIASREVRDFDIIFSPFDVVTIDLAPIYDDATGAFVNTSISSMDKSFRYNPLTQDYDPEEGFVTSFSDGTLAQSVNYLTTAQFEYEKLFGYVEVIGEAVLVGLTKTVANALVAAGHSINAWSWYNWNRPGGTGVPLNASNAPIYTASAVPVSAAYPRGITTNALGVGTIVSTFGNCLADVGNILTGVTYIVNNGTGGIGIDALAFQNFRTNTAGTTHRDLDNYALDTGVILHDSNFVGTTAEANDFRYAYNDTSLAKYQQTMYWATTFGPTWLDGDDVDGTISSEPGEVFYTELLTGGVVGGAVPAAINDPRSNSLDEVEAALAGAAGTTTHYFNNSEFATFFMLTYPTKHLHFPEDQINLGHLWTGWVTLEQLIQGGIVGYTNSLGVKQAIGSTEVCVTSNPTIFDTEENGVAAPAVADNVSPIYVQPPASQQVLCWEVNYANVSMWGVPYEEGWMSLTPAGPIWAGAYTGLALTLDLESGEPAFETALK